ncbi:MAG TPA: SDR family oxidoreductase, partial [Candidatus Binataceae bacterium]
MDLGLKGKVAMVTGGSRGLGRAMAQALAEEEMYVSICARNSRELMEAAAEITAASPIRRPAGAMVADVTKPEDMHRWIDDTVKQFGGIDVLVNNAGAAKVGSLAELPDSGWQESFDLNLFGPIRLARMCVPHMKTRSGGSIINISSIYGRESGGPLAYNASKAALISFTKMLAREFAPDGIRVNSIAPGSIIYPGGGWEWRFKENPTFERDFISHEMPAGR